jgi:hypothetical protein
MFGKFSFAAVFVLFFALSATVPSSAQTSADLSINGVKMGDRESARAFLTTFLPTTDDQGRTAYFFYNDLGTSVLKLTAASFDDPFMIVEIEVFTVGKSYSKAHFYLQKTKHFVTESNIFVGYKPSLTATLIGIPNLARESRIGPKDLVKKKGEPKTWATEGEREILSYESADLELPNEKGERVKFVYSARYEFRDKKLKRFVLSIDGRRQ